MRLSMRACWALIPGALCDARVLAKRVQTLLRTWRVIAPQFRRLRYLQDRPLERVRQAPQRIGVLTLMARNAKAGSQRRASWIELQRCGHFIPLEQPGASTRLLSHWLLLTPARAAHGSLA